MERETLIPFSLLVLVQPVFGRPRAAEAPLRPADLLRVGSFFPESGTEVTIRVFSLRATRYGDDSDSERNEFSVPSVVAKLLL